MPKTVRLQTPVVFGATTIAELTLRDPTGKDLRTLGMPVALGAIDTQAMGAWIAQLSGQTEPMVDMLGLTDWMAAATAVSGFFAQAAAVTTS